MLCWFQVYSKVNLLYKYLYVHIKSFQVVSNSLWSYGLQPVSLFCPWVSPGKNPGMVAMLTPTQTAIQKGSNFSLLCLLHWQMCCLPLAPLGKPTNTYIHTKSRTQLRRIIMHALFFSLFFFLPHIDHYRVLSRVPSAIQQVLVLCCCAVGGNVLYCSVMSDSL